MRTSRATDERRFEAGYNLVILMVAVAVMNILVAAAIPLWRTAMKRDKEEELIFRGWQYAEAIRVFQHRFGRLPVRLQELVEVKPRCIRQLWADPMTGKQDWVLIHVGTPDNAPPPNPGNQGNPGDQNGDQNGDQGNGDDNGQQPPGSGAFDPGATQNTTIGPIRGVHSRSSDKAIKRLFGNDRYDRWLFTVDLLQVGNQAAGHVGVPGPTIQEPVKWKGRPFREGVTPGGGPMVNAPPPPGLPPPPAGTGQPPPAPPPQPPAPGADDGGA